MSNILNTFVWGKKGHKRLTQKIRQVGLTSIFKYIIMYMYEMYEKIVLYIILTVPHSLSLTAKPALNFIIRKLTENQPIAYIFFTGFPLNMSTK